MEFVIFGILHRVVNSRVIYFIHLYFSLLPLLVTLVSESVLSVVSVCNTQGINSTSSWVYDHTSVIPVVPMSQDGSARSDLMLMGRRNSVVLATLRE